MNPIFRAVMLATLHSLFYWLRARLRSLLRWLRPTTWRWALRRRRQIPLAPVIMVHGIYVDGQQLLVAPVTGALFSEVAAPIFGYLHPQPIRHTLALRVQNVGPKPVMFQAVAFVDVSSNESNLFPFGPKELAPQEFGEFFVSPTLQGYLRRVMIPSLTERPTKAKSS